VAKPFHHPADDSAVHAAETVDGAIGQVMDGAGVDMCMITVSAAGPLRCGWLAPVLGCFCVLCALLLRDRPEEQGLTPLGETEADRARRGASRPNPSFEWAQVCKSGVLWHLATVYFAFGFSYVIYATFFIRYLVGEVGFTARDAGLLVHEHGFRLVAAGVMDMFPHTAHVESIAVFEPR
jgi:sugar phosphate permease